VQIRFYRSFHPSPAKPFYLLKSMYSVEARNRDYSNAGIARKALGNAVTFKFNTCLIKDAMPVSFRSELFTSYILTILKQ